MTEPVDPDIDLHQPGQRAELWRTHGAVLVVVAVGGAIGSLARYGLAQLLPTRPGHFPWATLLTNLSGCFLIGVLMVLISDVWTAHRLVRPLLGTGVLGGYTTFSTYASDIRALLQPDTVGLAFTYLAGTLVGALLAVLAGTWLTRTLTTGLTR